ncbi:putative tail fiber protein [Pseudomonas phage psageK4]|uniref:Tail fiber protein n=1 Tax=Pseudomonas phage psageK4 TaxID=2859563 RepID=A0ABX8SQN5_9CAUD|nr:putative tail fiber protein [Pseudomonas phage psageK4]QXV71742.1 putative tail fiber protein [Pseudomonas phage psageK4]
MDLIKYDMADIWASAGDVVAPDSAKIAQGWGVEVVPRQWWNWFENRQDNNLAYMLQKGFPEWDATTEYIINKSYVQRSGIVYKATATSTNSDPIALLSWVKAFPESSVSLEAIRTLTPAADRVPYYTGADTAALMTVTAFSRTLLDDPNVTTWRSTLGAQATHPNLTTLSTVTAAANALPYFTGTNSAATTTLTSFGRSLIDDADAVAARTTLGLTSAAITQLQANATERDIAKIMRVGAFGLGSFLDLRTHIYATGVPSDCYSAGTVFGFVNGGVGGLAIPGLSGTQYGVLQVNGQYSDASGLTAMSRVFIGPSGRTFTQTASSASAWGTWVESWTSGNLTKTTTARDTTAGSMLKFGDFGLGSAITIASDDLNTVVDSGFYRLGGSNPNLPPGGVAGFGQMIVSRGNDTISQMVIGYTGPKIWIRSGNPTNIGGVGVWTSWVELYHTGNTAQIVSDVTAGIQPQLDAKVNKTGDVMTGQLRVPNIVYTPLSGQGGTAYFLANGSTAPGGTDANITVDTPTAANNGGRMVINAGRLYMNCPTTTIGVASFQSDVNTSGNVNAVNLTGSGTVTGGYVTSTGNVNANGSFTGGGVSVTSSVTASSGSGAVTLNAGVVSIRASVASANAHVWFYDNVGNTRGIIYAQQSNIVTLQAGGAVCANFSPSGSASFNLTSTTGIENTGRVRSLKNGIPVNGSMYANCHYMAETNDGTPPAYSWHRGGSYALAVWLTNANELQMMGSDGITRELINNSNLPAWNNSIYANGNQNIGSYAFARNGGGTVGFGGAQSGSVLSPGSTGANSGALSGTWICLGYAGGGNHTLWIRTS